MTFLDLEVKSSEGEITQKYSDRSKSWVRNHYNLSMSQNTGAHATRASAGYTGYGEGSAIMKSTNGINSTGTSVASIPVTTFMLPLITLFMI